MHVFVLTYNEAELFTYVYNDEFVNQHCIPNDINFIVLSHDPLKILFPSLENDTLETPSECPY